ncbi:MAG: hypothetical protein ABI181_01440 [Mycobacteriaceae bacterium]
MTEIAFGDALGGVDGTGSPGELARFPDALAVAADPGAGSGTDADTWSSFALPSLPTSLGGGRAAAQALVDADPLPRVPPVPVPGGQWGKLQPAPSRPDPRRAQRRPAQGGRSPQPPAPAWAPRGGPARGTGRGASPARPGPASTVSESPTIRRRGLPPWVFPLLFLIVFIVLGYVG